MCKKPQLAGTVILLVILFFQTAGLAGEMQLTSDIMRYDPDKGVVYAEGNVKLTRDGMKIYSDRGEGSVDGTTVLFWNNVRGEGMWTGEEVYFTCDMAEATFSPETFYALKGKVEGRFGQREIIAETLELTAGTFIAISVDKFLDLSRGVEISGNRISGTLENKEITENISEGNVRIVLEDAKGKKIFIYGEKAVYSRERGSIVVTGNATALQDDRKIRADSLVLFPETNRIEAVGKSSLVVNPEKGKGN